LRLFLGLLDDEIAMETMTATKKRYEVHPLAALFPELGEEEMATLVESVRREGLKYPITLDAKDRIIDGRNRERACERAGVPPVYETVDLPEDKVADFILARNVARRHLSKGQQAVAIALAYPEPEKGGRGKNRKISLPFSKMLLSEARRLIGLDRGLAERVLKDGKYSLSRALDDARPEPEEQEQEEQEEQEPESKLEEQNESAADAAPTTKARGRTSAKAFPDGLRGADHRRRGG
jgi:ParB-like chromosome segregation protein Spo0J